MRPENEKHLQDAVTAARTRLDAAAAAAKEVADLELTAESPGGEVKVTVSNTGMVKKIHLDLEAAGDLPQFELDTLLTRTTAVAQKEMARHVHQRLKQAGTRPADGSSAPPRS